MDKAATHMRIYITEQCNAKCANCFNKDQRSLSTMDFDHFKRLCIYLNQNSVHHIKIMGGEPTMHPEFGRFVKFAQTQFDAVSVFTNAINNNICNFEPRASDSIIYNFKFSKAFTVEKMMANKPGNRALELQVSTNINYQSIKSEFQRITNLVPSISVNLTLDCTANIFAERDLILKNYEKIMELCTMTNINICQDHIAPLCFVKGSSIAIPNTGANCNEECAGLIDANYRLRYCNQFPKILATMFNSDESIIKWKDLQIIIHNAFQEILNTRKVSCQSCPYWEVLCNGGCFLGK